MAGAGHVHLEHGNDTVWSYEVGERAKFLDNRLRVNSSVYYEDWRRIQLEQLPGGYPLFDNVNTAHIYGGEVEVQTVVIRSLACLQSRGHQPRTIGVDLDYRY